MSKDFLRIIEQYNWKQHYEIASIIKKELDEKIKKNSLFYFLT